MRALRRIRPAVWGAATALALVVASASPVEAAGLATATSKPVTPNRWMRSVCRDVSTWLEARDEVDSSISETMGALTAGEIAAKAAKKRLTAASAQGVEAADELIEQVQSAGTPKVEGGKQLTKDYLATLADYRDAYEQARSGFKREKTRNEEQFIAAAQEIDATRVADLDEAGIDPVEELRPVAELAPEIESSCGDVNANLAAAIEPACGIALDTAGRVIEIDNQFYAADPESPEAIALLDEEDRLLAQLGVDLGACNVAGVPGPCRTTLETAQQLVQVHNQYLNTALDSPEEEALLNEQESLFGQLETEVACR